MKPIRINLLPPGVGRPLSISPLAQLPWKKIALAAGGLMAVVTLFLTAGNLRQSRALARLTREWESLAPERLRLQELQVALDALRIRESAVEKLKTPEARWAPRLNLLSDSIVSNLWFQGMIFRASRSSEIKKFLMEEYADLLPGLDQMIPEEPEAQAPEQDPSTAPQPEAPWPPRLWLRGSALVLAKEGAAQGAPVRRFIQRLKEQPEFAKWFGGLELKDVGHEQRGQYEVSDFILILYPTGV